MRDYARGDRAWGICKRSGRRMLLKDLVEDDQIPGLLVDPEWYEPRHPQEFPVSLIDPEAIWRPASELSVDGGAPVIAALSASWSPAPVNETIDEGSNSVTLYTFTALGGYAGYTYIYQLFGTPNIEIVQVSPTTIRLRARVTPLGDTVYSITVAGTVTDALGQQATAVFSAVITAHEPLIPAGLVLVSDNGLSNTRPGWDAVDKITGAQTPLSGMTGAVAQITIGISWQPAGNYVAIAYSSTAPRIGIFKRTLNTGLDRLTVGVPSWSSFKTCCAWDGDDRLIGVGEVSLYCEVASRSGDTFTMISSPLNVQHVTNNFSVDARNGIMILGGNRDGSNFNIRTYSWNGSQYIFGSGYDLGASSTAREIRISPDGLTVAVSCLLGASAAGLRIYSISGTTLTQVHANLILSGTAGPDPSIAFSPDSQFLYFQAAAGTVVQLQGWKNISGTWTPITLGVPLLSGSGVSVSPQGNLLAACASGAGRRTVYSIDPSTGALTILSTSAWPNNSGSDLAFNRNLNL